MPNILFPIHLDRWKSPVSSSLRELTLRNPQLDFYSFSSPQTPEDQEYGRSLWSQTHIHQTSPRGLLRQSFDIVHHASATTRNVAAVKLAKLRSLGNCLHLFTAPIQPHKEDVYYKQYVQSVHRADMLTSVSYAVADDILAQFGRKVDAVIPSGVDLTFFDPAIAAPVDTTQYGIQRPYVLFVGILTDRKRPDIFLQLAELVPELDFVMVGAAYTEAEQEQYRREAAAYPNVKLLGAVPRAQVRDLMAQAIALVFPSELEGLPLTILEAAAMGLPILAQPKSAMPEAVIPDVTGWLLKSDRLSLWAAKLQEIAQWSGSDRAQFGQQARSFVQANYSWEYVAQQYKELYANMLN
jgi:alpha-maltose-1-phosphate synthase